MRSLSPALRRAAPAIAPFVVALSFATAAARAADASTQAPPAAVEFLKTHCSDCHQGTVTEGAFDLDKLGVDLADPAVEKRWVRIFDRVREGEMPPPDADQPPEAQLEEFLDLAGGRLREVRTAQDAAAGRVRARRLTRREVERSLHSVLGVDIPLADQLPEEPRSGASFTTVAGDQSISHFHLERHLSVVDLALDESYRRAFADADDYARDFDARAVARENPRRRCREPEMRDGQAVTWSSGLTFYGRLPCTAAPASGWYRFAVTLSGLKLPETGGVWCTVNTGLCVSSAPLLAPVTIFEATEKPQTIEFEAWLPKGHMLEIRPGDTTLKKARFQGGQVGVGEGEPQDVPGIAIDRLSMRRIHHGSGDDELRRILFGDLPIKTGKKRHRYVAVRAPRQDMARLMHAMAQRAFRRPVAESEIAGYVALAQAAYEERQDFDEALRVGYRALLCSPRFLYLTENPGKLDDYAVAARLSYFLTGAPPDEQLTALAASGRLHDPQTLRSETDRLLAAGGARRFVEDFAAEWLDLDQIDFTEPDGKLYPAFDAVVKQSMLDETRTFVTELLRDDLSVARLIDADYTYLNSRLGRFYGIGDVKGDALRKVSFEPDDRRGGVITQGAILKVTANGSNTSPVVRGVWVSERLLGTHIPPPPSSVPAIEPDIRGAQTIRDQLLKHRSEQSCAVCHKKIDPPGFALENFDPSGRWRDRYFQVEKRKKITGPKIDSGYVLEDGREFADVGQFLKLVASDEEKLAECVAEKLLVYGTGGAISFADRDAVAQIVEAAADHNYGFRSILYAVVTSPTFLSK